jgi:GntR family transcriptional regulator, transcriptional repressor for pyruvate dehydrogenase complex
MPASAESAPARTVRSPVPRASLPDHVFAALREAVISGEYLPGERLPPQRALAAEFGVNMASVREALKRLEQLRLVDVRHGDATRVLDWRRSGGLEALARGERMDAELMRDLFEARRLLLAEAARLAAERRTDAQAQALSAAAARIAGTAGEHEALLADWDFMAALVEAAGNLVFRLVMNSVRELYLPHADAFAALVSGRAQLEPLYARAAQAVADKDSAGAGEAIEALTIAQGTAVSGGGRTAR